jgi:putative chitinase
MDWRLPLAIYTLTPREVRSIHCGLSRTEAKMIITSERLVLLAPRIAPAVADELSGALETAMPRFGITDLLPRAHFLAQAAHESQGFTRFGENLHYTSPARIAAVWPRLALRADELAGKPEALANAAYGGKGGNGDEASGDGWRYRGRGLFQLTGRHNYTLAGEALGVDLAGTPDPAAEPELAALTALWFWQQRGCTAAALKDDVDAVTRIINGPMREGLAQRQALTDRAKAIFV